MLASNDYCGVLLIQDNITYTELSSNFVITPGGDCTAYYQNFVQAQTRSFSWIPSGVSDGVLKGLVAPSPFCAERFILVMNAVTFQTNMQISKLPIYILLTTYYISDNIKRTD